MEPITVYIGLGSNLHNPVHQVQTAFAALSQLSAAGSAQLSGLYRSTAVGPAGQPDYINAVARLVTTLSPIELLQALQSIEQQQLRMRGERWGPRTIDLDLLLYGEVNLNTPRLKVPHPYLKQRSFVLAPLQDLNPLLQLPDGASVPELLAQIDCRGTVKLPPTELLS